MRKSIAAAGVTASLLAGSFVGAAVLPSGIGFAQDGAETEQPADEARPEPGAWVKDTIDELVADGTINRAQGDAVLAALEENRPARPLGHDGPRGARLETVAEIIGIDVSTLVQELRDGATLAEVAEAHGVKKQELIDALVAEAEEHLAQAVADGKLTQAQADEISNGLVGRITSHVNGEAPMRPGGPGRGDGPFGGRFREGGADGAEAAA
jgi:hypothetical protein